MGVLSFLLGNKNLILGVMLMVALSIVGVRIKLLKSKLAETVAQKAVVVNQLKISQDSVRVLSASIDTQNNLIDKMKTDAENRVKTHKAELEAATKQSNVYKKKATDIMAQKIKAGESACDAVNDLFDGELGK